MRRVCGDDELHRPGRPVIELVYKDRGNLRELCDEDLLHLWMQMDLRLFNKDQVDARQSVFNSVRLEDS